MEMNFSNLADILINHLPLFLLTLLWWSFTLFLTVKCTKIIYKICKTCPEKTRSALALISGICTGLINLTIPYGGLKPSTLILLIAILIPCSLILLITAMILDHKTTNQ